MSDLIDKIKHDAFRGDYLKRLLYLNTAFLVFYGIYVLLVRLVPGSKDLAAEYIALSSDPWNLVFKPWTMITFMFTHFHFRHFIFNMFVLYFSGRLFMEYLGQKRLLALYIYSSLFSAFLYIILFPVFNATGPETLPHWGNHFNGASAGAISILVAIAIYLPNMPVRLWGVFEIKQWVIAAIFVGYDFFSIAIPQLLAIINNSSSNITSFHHFAHLGGALVAYFFIRSMRNGHEWNVYLFQVIDAVRNTLYRNSRKRRGFKFGERNYTKYEEVKTKKGNTTNPDTSKMDEILDKIKEKGYDSLSKEEKAYLFKISKDQ